MSYNHLSDNQIEQYKLRQMAAPELLKVHDHIAQCTLCRQRLAAALPLKQAFGAWQRSCETAREELSAADYLTDTPTLAPRKSFFFSLSAWLTPFAAMSRGLAHTALLLFAIGCTFTVYYQQTSTPPAALANAYPKSTQYLELTDGVVPAPPTKTQTRITSTTRTISPERQPATVRHTPTNSASVSASNAPRRDEAATSPAAPSQPPERLAAQPTKSPIQPAARDTARPDPDARPEKTRSLRQPGSANPLERIPK